MSTDGKPYSAMNAKEKTEYLGFKMFSDRELKDRQKAAVSRRTEGVKKFVGDVLSSPQLELGKHMDEAGLEPIFKDAVNNFYTYAVQNNLSIGDLDAIFDDIVQIAYMFARVKNEASSEVMRLSYALTGENALVDVPLNSILKITETVKSVAPRNTTTEYDNEPSLSQTEDTVVDVPKAE